MPAEFHVHNLGCKVNRAESDALEAALCAAGGLPVTRERARVVVVNTCAVTAEAEAKTRKAIRQALASSAVPWVVVTGCAVALDQGSYRALGRRVAAEPDRLLAQERALELLGLTAGEAGEAAPQGAAGEAVAEPGAARRVAAAEPGAMTGASAGARGRRSRLGIKIQDGCNGVCCYCVVRIARGPARSVPQAEVRERVCAAERDGIREVVLTGVNIGSYDDGDFGLTHLVSVLLAATSETRIRLSSVEPQHLDDELLDVMAAARGRLCAHLHLPLQSGCDRTLAAMSRPYDSAFFAERVVRARSLMPHIALTTDLIAGFPGESDEDFEESLKFCERMGFARMHVFRYSRRPQTPAATLPGQVPPALSAARARRLRELSARMCSTDATARIGRREDVLVENRGRGTSESYHRVAVPPSLAVGRLLPMRITGYRDTLLQATP